MSKLKFTSLALTLLIFATLTSAATTNADEEYYSGFPDVQENHENYDAIIYIEQQGMIDGYPDGSYRPDNNITRAEFIKILVKTIEPNPSGENCFSDVKGDWYAPYVCYAKNNGIIDGYADGTFKPANYINFAEAAKIIVNTLNLEMPESQDNDPWYKKYILALEAKSAIPTTINYFDKEISRGEMAEIIYRLKADMEPKESKTYAQLEEDANAIDSMTYFELKDNIRLEDIPINETYITVIDLGEKGDGGHYDINNNGTALFAINDTETPAYHNRAPLYQLWDGKFLTSFGKADPSEEKDTSEEGDIPISINDNGTVILNSGPIAKIFENGEFKNIDIKSVEDINNKGQIVGKALIQDEMGNENYITFLYENGQITKLETSGWNDVRFFEINDDGQIVGSGKINEEDRYWQAFLLKNNEMINLGAFFKANFSDAVDINNNGQILVNIHNSDSTLKEYISYIWENDKTTNLDPPNNDIFDASDINNNGEVVGRLVYNIPYKNPSGDLFYYWDFREEKKLEHDYSAALWRDGEIINLNDWVDPDSGIFLKEALSINDNGQILAIGTSPMYNGDRVFFLTLPENPPNRPPKFKFTNDIPLRFNRYGDKLFDNDEITIEWEDYDFEDNASISLYYYNLNNFNLDDLEQEGTLIIDNLKEDDDINKYIWDISNSPTLNPGIYAVIDDGINPPQKINSNPLEERINDLLEDPESSFFYIDGYSIDDNINILPSLEILSPRICMEIYPKWYKEQYPDVVEGTPYPYSTTIEWKEINIDDNATISFYYYRIPYPEGDGDYEENDLQFPENYNEYIDIEQEGELIAQFEANPHEGGGEYVWDTSNLLGGIYYIYGIIDDGINPIIKVYNDGLESYIKNRNK